MRNWFKRRAVENSAAEPATPPAIPGLARWTDILHVFVLVNFAIAQPVYDRLGERSAFLIDMQMGMPTLVTLVALLSVILPTFIVSLERLALCWSGKAYNALHLSVVFVLLLLLMLPIGKLAVMFDGLGTICISLIGAAVGTTCYLYFRSIRNVVTLASPGVIIFPAAFLVHAWSGMVAVLPASSKSAKWDPAPVVMLVFDEFCGASLMTPERQIDEDRFPNFAELGRHATWFRNATSVNAQTEYAVPALLSGRYPPSNILPTPAELPQNVFSVLKFTGGYEIAAFEPVSRLAPKRFDVLHNRASDIWAQTTFLSSILWRVYLYHITPTDFIRKLPQIPVAWFGLNADTAFDAAETRGVFRYSWGDKREAQFQHFLNCINGSAEPALHFMHLLLPHVPWCYLPSGRRYTDDGKDWDLLDLSTHGMVENHWGPDQLEVIQSQQRYLLQLMYVDRLIGKLIARLKETGQYDRCLLIVTSDHGVCFRANEPRRNPVAGNFDEILSIPLFFKRPGQTEGQVNDRAVESIDILPSIADVLGITLHGQLDGWSVFDESRPERQQKHYGNALRLSKVDPRLITNSNIPQELRQRFGDGADPEAIFRIGPVPELHGTRTASLKQSASPPLELDLIRYGDEFNDQASFQVPSLYEGAILSNIPLAESPVILAVAVNGTIRAVTRTYQQAGYLNQWAAMVPESAFHEGKNDVKFFRVTGSAPHWELTPCITQIRPKVDEVRQPEVFIP